MHDDRCPKQSRCFYVEPLQSICEGPVHLVEGRSKLLYLDEDVVDLALLNLLHCALSPLHDLLHQTGPGPEYLSTAAGKRRGCLILGLGLRIGIHN